jgi:hypothetical protein
MLLLAAAAPASHTFGITSILYFVDAGEDNQGGAAKPSILIC